MSKTKREPNGDTPSILYRDGEVVYRGTWNACLVWLHNYTGYSWDYNFKYNGYELKAAGEA